MVRGYWNKPEATAETFVDGWLRTGDIARIDEEGFIFIVDRVKDMVIRGGENVYCAEVEGALFEHPSVTDCAVIGVPHQVLGEEVGAVVVLKPGETVSDDALRAHVRERLAGFKVPTHIWFSDERAAAQPGGQGAEARPSGFDRRPEEGRPGVKVGDVELAVREEGRGPTFLWGHGLLSSMAQEDEIGAFDWSATTQSMRLVRYDARGHGESETSDDPEALRWQALADRHARCGRRRRSGPRRPRWRVHGLRHRPLRRARGTRNGWRSSCW